MNFTTFLGTLYLFGFGAFVGWVIELLYRNLKKSEKKLINPGFLNGPYLPLYGCGAILLYLISSIETNIIYKIILIFFTMTLIELLTGLFFVKVYNVRLWDYSKHKFNYKGQICPLYSFFWTILGMIFYLFIYPYLYSEISLIITSMLASFLLGAFYATITIDTVYSLGIIVKLKNELAILEEKAIVNYSILKKEISDRRYSINFANFLFNFKESSIRDELRNYIEKRRK